MNCAAILAIVFASGHVAGFYGRVEHSQTTRLNVIVSFKMSDSTSNELVNCILTVHSFENLIATAHQSNSGYYQTGDECTRIFLHGAMNLRHCRQDNLQEILFEKFFILKIIAIKLFTLRGYR